MHRWFCAVFVLVTVVPSNTHIQASAASPPRLSTTYMINQTDDSTQAFLRVAAPSSVPSLTFALQTDLTNCNSEVTGNYTSHALHITGSYRSHALVVTAFRHRRVGGVVSGHELLSVAWRPMEETVIVAMPKITFSLATGYEGEAGGKWWRLWARDNEEEEATSSGTPPQPNKDDRPNRPPTMGGNAAETRVGRGVLIRTYLADSIWGLSMDILLPDEQRRLVNFTFTAHDGTQWQMSIKVPPLSVALDWKSRIWQSQGKQHKQVEGEVRSSKSGTSMKFSHYELEKQGKETQISKDNGKADGMRDVGGCGDSSVREPQGKSQHCANNDRGPDLGISREMDLNYACTDSDHTPMGDLTEGLRYEYDQDSTKNNLVEEYSKEAGDAGLVESMSSDALQEIRQKITSSVFSFSSNMTTFVLPDGGHSIRILQHSHLSFCPRLSWTLNQIFRFMRDWSGWEYVVSAWEWGCMVVKGEWGASFLQWYQKTFTFSFDQGAALPSTQLVLDFRDWRSFKVWVKWPALASALAASLTLGNDHHTLLVEEVDEFVGEGAAEVVVRVVTRHTPSGLSLSYFADSSKIKDLHAAATARLAQAITRSDVCGEVPDHITLERFLHDLLGQSPASLWIHLLQESRRLLLGSGSKEDLYYLLEVLEEEMGTAGGAAGLWELAWTTLERLGLSDGDEDLEVLVPWEWVELAQSWWAWVVEGSGGQCEGGALVERLLVVLARTLKQGGH